MSEVKYALLRRDRRGIVRLRTYEKYGDALEKRDYLTALARKRDLNSVFYIKLTTRA